MKRWLAVLPMLAVGACGPTKRFDQDLQGREKPSAIWHRADVSHVRRVIPASGEHRVAAVPRHADRVCG
jgi:hypothetical protein